MKYYVGQRFYGTKIGLYITIKSIVEGSHYRFMVDNDPKDTGNLTENELASAIRNGYLIKEEPLELLRYIKRLELI